MNLCFLILHDELNNQMYVCVHEWQIKLIPRNQTLGVSNRYTNKQGTAEAVLGSQYYTTIATLSFPFLPWRERKGEGEGETEGQRRRGKERERERYIFIYVKVSDVSSGISHLCYFVLCVCVCLFVELESLTGLEHAKDTKLAD